MQAPDYTQQNIFDHELGLSSLSLSLFACVSFIDFTSFHSLYSLDLFSLCTLPGDDPEGTLEVKQYAETGQAVVEIDRIHRIPP
jgi:hypothetical protein